MPAVFAAVADDDTGATDLAGMLADQGLRTVLLIDLPEPDDFAKWTAGYDAVIAGAGTRALSPAEAYARTCQAVRLLAALHPRAIQIKYCSTFDSTEEGNIGPSLDAAMDELDERFTVALPALPVNGRTTYMGHHFVNGRLLSDSPMRDHPLTPMRNSNLVTHLQAQTKRKVGLAAYPVDRAKLEAVRHSGVEIAILDCIDDPDLERVCEAIANLRLISGSSAPAMKLPEIWKRNGWWRQSGEPLRIPSARSGGFLVVAGSASVATRSQNDHLEAKGVRTIRIDARALLAGEANEAREAAKEIGKGRTCLLKTSSTPADVAEVQSWAATQGIKPNDLGLKIAYGLATVVKSIVEQSQPAGLIVAGGETSGAICRTLEFGALAVGCNIEPGVPLCLPLGKRKLPLVLKSGNFGSPDFYTKAISTIRAAPNSSIVIRNS